MVADGPQTPARRRIWSCAECSVAVRNADGDLIPEPSGWEEGLCITCQRKAADREGGSKAVLVFELRRNTPLKKAARRSGTTMASARGVRAAMVRNGEVPELRKRKQKEKRDRRTSSHRENAERALRADPTRPNIVVAKETGASPNVVKRARARLGLPGPTSILAKDAEALRALGGPTTITDFAGRIGVSRARAGKRLKALHLAGLATLEVRPGHNGRAQAKVYSTTSA